MIMILDLLLMESYSKIISPKNSQLYQSNFFLTRIQQKSLNFDGYELEPGQLVMISIYAMGRNPKLFFEPEKFDPERWIRNPKSGKLSGVLNSFASLPFGFGSRSCIGRRLAENQMEYLIKRMFDVFDIQVMNKEKVEMIMKLIGLPDTEIKFRLKKK